MYESPRIRRLRNDLEAMHRLQSKSSIFRFAAAGSWRESWLFRFAAVGDAPQQYVVSFQGKGLWREGVKVKVLQSHCVDIKLGASYPRTVPELRWLTPIFHPNISEIGVVCLTDKNCAPSIQLDDLCIRLWDIARYHNYDIRFPYNHDAPLWVAGQATFRFPIDDRPLRDMRAA